MKFIKSDTFKWTLVTTATIAVLGTTFVAITIKNNHQVTHEQSLERRRTKENRLTDNQKKVIKDIEPIIRETIQSELDVEADELFYHFKGKTTTLESVSLTLSENDLDGNVFFDTKFFTEFDDEYDEDSSITFDLSDYNPNSNNLDEILKKDINEIIEKMYFALLEKNEVNIDQFYHALTPKQNQIFLKNYRDLSKLEGSEFANEMFRLNLAKPFFDEY